MNTTTPKTEQLTSTRPRQAVSGGSFKTVLFSLALGFGFFTATASADVLGYFKFDNFPGGNANFTDDTGKGLRGLLGFPFSTPSSVAGPSGLPGDRAVSFDLDGGLAVDDSGAELLNIVTPPLTLECWVRSSNASQIGVHRAFISYGIPGGPPVEGVVRGGYKLGILPNGSILFTLFAVVDVSSAVPFPFDGEWHHVAASYWFPDDGVHFFLDGQEVAFAPETREFTPPGNRQLDIGAQDTGTARFDGDIDRVRISKAAMTAEQLDSVAGAVKPVLNNTVVFFNFDEISPPYKGQGLPPAGVAIPTAEWVINHPPRILASAGGPKASGGGPAVVNLDTPSGAEDDHAIRFGGANFSADMAAVWDPNGALNLDRDWTLEAWIKIDAPHDGDRDVIFYYGYPEHGYSLSVNYAEGNKLQVTTLGIEDLASDTAILDADSKIWQHIAVAHKSGQSITYFINGIEAGTRPYAGGTRLAETNKILYIGAEWDGGLPFTGWIDRVRISDTALTASELDSDPLNPAASPLRLAIARSQSNVILSWPEAGSAGYILEFGDNLTNPTWSTEVTSPVAVAGRQTVTVPITGSTRYYRLKHP